VEETGVANRWKAVLIGAAAGLLSTVVAGLVASLAAGALGVNDPFESGVVVGAVVGLFVAGFTTAKFVQNQWALHGSFAALLTVLVVGTDALLRGSAATPVTLAGYAVLAALLGAAGGWLGSRGQR
jgi:hypothetical protein